MIRGMDEQLLPDLLQLRGSVVTASDEFFAAKENLTKATAPVFVPDTYDAKGQVYDGWETRRRRGPGGKLPDRSARDWVIVRLGVPGVLRAIVSTPRSSPAMENGADVAAGSDQSYFSAPRNMISPGLSRVMSEGWETRRRRRPGYEWLVIRLAGHGVIDLAEIDTSWYRGNQPESASLQTLDASTGASLTDKSAWRELLPPVRLLPDTPHRFRVTGQPATHVRLNIFPDGGVARLRLYGSLTDDGLAAARHRWDETA
jgi:allantoicase